MNLFQNIFSKVTPTQSFLSGFTPTNPDIFTGKTTSEKIASGEIKSKTLPQDKMPVAIGGREQYGAGKGGILGNIFRDMSKTPSTFDPNSIIQGAQNAQANITSYYNNQISPEAVKNLQATNSYHTQQKLKEYILAKKIPREQASQLVNSLISSGHVIQGINDQDVQNPSIFRGGELGKAIGGFASSPFASFNAGVQGGQNIVSGVGNVAQGNTALGASQIGLGAVQGTMPTFGAGMPVATGIFGGLASTSTGGDIMQGVNEYSSKGVGAAQGAMGFNPNSEASKNVQEIGANILPMVATVGLSKLGVVAPKKVSKGIKGVQEGIANTSDAIQTGLNRMTKGQINKFQAEQGVSPGKYLNDRGIVSSGKPIEETLLEQMKASRDQATAGMNAIKGNYKMPERRFGDGKIDYLREMLLDNYNKATKTLDAEGSNTAKTLLDKYDAQGLTMSEINTAKRTMADNNPVNWLTDSASDRVQTVKKISDEVRNWQFKQAEDAGFKNLKEINKQTQAFYRLHEGITKWNEGIEANNKISLTDYLAFDADPSVFVAKKILSAPSIRQGIVKGLNKLSGRVVKPIEKATISDINTKRAEYNFGNRNNNTSNRMDTGKQLALPAPSGKATGAKNIRVNQPKEKPPLESTKNAIIRDPRKKALDDYRELESLGKLVDEADSYNKAQARRNYASKIEQIKLKMLRESYEKAMSKEMKSMVREDIKNSFPEGLITSYNKLNGILKRKSSKGYFNDIEGEMGVLKRDFSDAVNSYNNLNGTNYSATQLFEQLQKWIGDNALSRTPSGPTSFNTSGKKVIKKAPESPVAMEKGYTTSIKKPIVKRSADVESGLIEEARKYKIADEFAKNSTNTYHGTSQLFDEFNNEALGRSTSTIAGKKGFWFTDDKGEALAYAKMSGKHMLKDELRIEKEINKLLDEITIAEKKGNWDLADKLTEKISILEQESRAGGSEIVMPVRINKSNMLTYDANGISMNQGRIDKIIEQARKEGKDGVTFKNISDHPEDASIKTTQHFIFDTKNIKTESQLKRLFQKIKSND